MYHITGNQKRNAKAALFNSRLLDCIYLHRINAIQYRTHLALGSHVHKPVAARDLVHLSYLLTQGHPGKKLISLSPGIGISAI